MNREVDVDEVIALCDRASRGRWVTAPDADADPTIIVAEIGAIEILAPALRLFDEHHDAEADAAFITGVGNPLIVKRLAEELRNERASTDELVRLVVYLAGKASGCDISDAPADLLPSLYVLSVLGEPEPAALLTG